MRNLGDIGFGYELSVGNHRCDFLPDVALHRSIYICHRSLPLDKRRQRREITPRDLGLAFTL